MRFSVIVLFLGIQLSARLVEPLRSTNKISHATSNKKKIANIVKKPSRSSESSSSSSSSSESSSSSSSESSSHSSSAPSESARAHDTPKKEMILITPQALGLSYQKTIELLTKLTHAPKTSAQPPVLGTAHRDRGRTQFAEDTSSLHPLLQNLANDMSSYDGTSRKHVGGEDITELPFMAQLIIDGNFICGASIIGKQWAVTAAHCINREPERSIDLRVGTSLPNSGGVTHSVSYVVPHWMYNPSDSNDYDIALIKVEHPFKFGDNVKAVGLPEQDYEVKYGKKAIASGWENLLDGNNNGSQILQRVELEVLKPDDCSFLGDMLGWKVTDHMICALDYDLHAPRHGDAGGPLIASGKLIGVISFGEKNYPRLGVPAVFTRVASVRNWIKGVAGV